MKHTIDPKSSPDLMIVRLSKWRTARLVFLTALFVFALYAAFLGLSVEPQEATGSSQVPGTAQMTYSPDPCSLNTVTCPDEQPAYTPQPPPPDPADGYVLTSTVYTYHAVPEQTDGDPCTTADGTDICPFPSLGIVANNCLDMGTSVLIRGEQYFVHDRMNSRYGCDVFDILTDGDVYTLHNEPVTVL